MFVQLEFDVFVALTAQFVAVEVKMSQRSQPLQLLGYQTCAVSDNNI